MILDCNFEELRALSAGADLLLQEERLSGAGAVAAPAEALAEVALLEPRLTGSLEITTLAEQRRVRSAVSAICRDLRERMDDAILEFHPAHEEAVALFFDYAHSRTVLNRLDHMGREMTALLELITGSEPTEEAERSITL